MKSEAKKLGNIIRGLRQKRRLTQEQVAEIADLHPTYIGSLERGEKNVTVRTLSKIAIALEIEIHQIFQLVKVKEEAKRDISENWTIFLQSLSPRKSEILLDWMMFLKELPVKTSASLLEVNQKTVSIFSKKRR